MSNYDGTNDKGEILLYIEESNINLEIKLTRVCYECLNDNNEYHYAYAGSKRHAKTPKNKCAECNGSGYILTDNGRAVAKLIKHLTLPRLNK